MICSQGEASFELDRSNTTPALLLPTLLKNSELAEHSRCDVVVCRLASVQRTRTVRVTALKYRESNSEEPSVSALSEEALALNALLRICTMLPRQSRLPRCRWPSPNATCFAPAVCYYSPVGFEGGQRSADVGTAFWRKDTLKTIAVEWQDFNGLRADSGNTNDSLMNRQRFGQDKIPRTIRRRDWLERPVEVSDGSDHFLERRRCCRICRGRLDAGEDE